MKSLIKIGNQHYNLSRIHSIEFKHSSMYNRDAIFINFVDGDMLPELVHFQDADRKVPVSKHYYNKIVDEANI